MPELFPLRSVPYESLRDSQLPTRERRKLYHGQIDSSGPIPRIASIETIGDKEYSNAVALKQPISGGALIAFEGRFPTLSLHIMRIDASGKAMWTTDTRITREPQVLSGSGVIVFRGWPLVERDKFAQPVLVLLNTQTGKFTTHELRW